MRVCLRWMAAFVGVGCAGSGATEACLADFSEDAGFPLGDAATIAKVEAQCDAEATPCTVSVTPRAAECIARENGLPEGDATTWLVYHSTFETAVWNVQVVTNDRTDGFDGQAASIDAVTGAFLGLSSVSASASR